MHDHFLFLISLLPMTLNFVQTLYYASRLNKDQIKDRFINCKFKHFFRSSKYNIYDKHLKSINNKYQYNELSIICSLVGNSI